MKRILSLSILFGLIAAQAPIHADSKSHIVNWATNDINREAIQKGLAALKTDAATLANASWNVAKAGYNGLPTARNAFNSIEKGIKAAVASPVIFCGKYPALMSLASFGTSAYLLHKLSKIRYDDNNDAVYLLGGLATGFAGIAFAVAASCQ